MRLTRSAALCLVGYTGSTNFPLVAPFQASNGGGDAFVTKVASPTAVVVRSFSAVRSGLVVTLRWRTGSEAALLGFKVYRERAGVRKRLNQRLLPAGAGSDSLRDRWVSGVR